MKIEFKDRFGHTREIEVHEYIEAVIERGVNDDFARSEVTVEALGRLVEVLANKGVLDESEVRHIATGV